MALMPIDPFDFETYRHKTEEFARWLTDYVETNEIHGRTGWLAWFTSYGWGKNLSGSTWQRGVIGRANYHIELKHSLSKDDNQLIGVVNRIIMKFHGMGEKSSYYLGYAPKIREALHVLGNELDTSSWSPQKLYNVRRIAAISKVYQMLDPNKWVIYDSRVATALACLIRRFWIEKNREVCAELLRVPIPRRNIPGWKPPDGFPEVSGHQGPLAFVYASWLLRYVAEILRSDSKYGCPPTVQDRSKYYPLDPNWQVYHLEMALWMLGNEEF